MRHVSIKTALLFILVAEVLAQDDELINNNANAAFEIGDVFVSASETYRGELKVPNGDDGIDSFIPLTFHHGAKECNYAISGSITLPCTSVSRKSLPW